MIRQYELVERVRAYDPSADEDLLNRAYVFSMKAHGSQTRASGDPYFSHPLEVAGILTNLKLDAATIVTALLHDTVEDTVATQEDIERVFGREIGRLVDGVTKLSRLEMQSEQAKQAENFRKLVLAMSEDIRVLLVKLADRLHNMRTIHHIKNPDKRKRISRETLEIYAPLAERIGMHQVKDELEDLAFAQLNPEARDSILAQLARLRSEGEDRVQRIIDELTGVLAEEGVPDAQISGREKTPYSIWRKLQQKNVSFEQLSDIMAFRIIVGNVGECYQALGIIHSRYPVVPGRFKDYISTPKPNGYKSLHTGVIGPQRNRIEVQIRTREMHEVCELGVAAHWAYKQGQPRAGAREYRWLRELLDILEHATKPEEFLEHTKLELFQDQVFCFTPKGDLIALPRGATPVDFAYAVHSEVGDHCVGGRSFFQVHLGADGRPDECRYFTAIDEVAPASSDEWAFWLDPAEGMIGWPEFQTKDGKLYARQWAPGSARVAPRDLAETRKDAGGERPRRLHAMLYAAPTGAASPAPETEYILVAAVEEAGQAWVEVHAGIDVNPATLSLA